MHTVLYL